MPHWILETTKCKPCGKVSYASRDDAEYAAKSMLQPMFPYQCFYGNGWHLATERKGRATGSSPAWKAGGPRERPCAFESRSFRQSFVGGDCRGSSVDHGRAPVNGHSPYGGMVKPAVLNEA